MSKSRARRGGRRGNRQQSFPWIGVMVGIGVLAILGGLIVSVQRQTLVIDGVRTFTGLSREHVAAAPAFEQNPPVGGAHNAAWQNCGIYDTPVDPALAVHSLEHGAVWISYQPSLGSDGVERLRSLVRGQSYTLLSPSETIPGPIGLSAWGNNLVVEDPNDPRIEQFITKYRNGTQTPEPGAQCIGGVGTPIDR